MTPDDLKHTKITERTQQPDGSTKIHAKSYYEELAYEKVELERQVIAGRDSLLKDFLSCLDLVTRENSPEVIITVKHNPNRDGWQIIKRWTVEKKQLNHHKN